MIDNKKSNYYNYNNDIIIYNLITYFSSIIDKDFYNFQESYREDMKNIIIKLVKNGEFQNALFFYNKEKSKIESNLNI